MRQFSTIILIAALVASLSGMAFAGGECCSKARAENGWCGDCKVGFFADLKVKSAKLHTVLAAHKVDPASIACPGCKDASAKSSTCCDKYFANGQAFKSKYAAAVARGQALDPAKLAGSTCQGCKTAAKDSGWCEDCNVGLVSQYAFKDKKAHKEAAEAYAIIQKAVKVAEHCETCAVALVTDGSCKSCSVSFKNGKTVEI